MLSAALQTTIGMLTTLRKAAAALGAAVTDIGSVDTAGDVLAKLK